MREFKDILKDLRNSRRMTQDSLSSALHITKQALSHYERGTRYPKRETLESIADYFNVDMNYLTGRSETTTIIPTPAATLQTTPDQEELMRYYDALNNEGQAKVRDYAADLVAGGRYGKDAGARGAGSVTSA